MIWPLRSRTAAQRKSRSILIAERLEDRTLFSTYTVANLADHGTGSLRQAILNANANAGTNTIAFASGLHGTIPLTTGQLLITRSVSIEGPGASVVSVSGNDQSRVFEIEGATSKVSINGLTVTKANPGLVFGGGILNYGILTLTNCVVSDNVCASLEVDGVFGGGAGLSNFGMAYVSGTWFVDNTVYAHDDSSRVGGGAIYNANDLWLTNDTIKNNAADVSPSVASNAYVIVGGGGIYSRGNTMINDTTISGNSVTNINVPKTTLDNTLGGGICSIGTLTVTASTISGNTLFSGGGNLSDGGGIYAGGTTMMENSTIYDNTSGALGAGGGDSSAGNGGGITQAHGTMTLVNCTIADNLALDLGGGINLSGGTLKIGNTILATNSDQGEDQSPVSNFDFLPNGGTLDSLGHNLVGAIGDSNLIYGKLWATSDILGTGSTVINPKLGPLGNNGGLTETLAITSASPAYNAGNNTIANDYGLTTDQRGKPRIDHGTVDIGAYEA